METPYDPNALPGQRGYMSRYESNFGKREGLADRLDAAAEVLAKDRTTAWLGLGLYKDLIAAASALRGEPEKTTTEYDL